MAVTDPAEADALEGLAFQCVEQFRGRLDRVVGKAEAARVDVGGSAREGRECGLGADESVRRLVEGAVARKNRHHLNPFGGCASSQAGGVAPTGGLRDLEVVVGAERLLDHHAGASRDRRSRRIDDEKHPHEGAGYRPPLRNLPALFSRRSRSGVTSAA